MDRRVYTVAVQLYEPCSLNLMQFSQNKPLVRITIFFHDWDDMRRKLEVYVKRYHNEYTHIIPLDKEWKNCHWHNVWPQFPENISVMGVIWPIVGQEVELKQKDQLCSEAMPLPTNVPALTGNESVMFVGINAGEDWSNIVFDRDYAYLYYDGKDRYELRCTNVERKNWTITVDSNVRLPLREPQSSGMGRKLKEGEKFSSANAELMWTSSTDWILNDEARSFGKSAKESKVSLLEKVSKPFPLLPEMIHEKVLLWQTCNERYWLGKSHCIFKETEGLVIGYIRLRKNMFVHDETPLSSSQYPFRVDPHGNIFVVDRWTFEEQVFRKCFCDQKYHTLRLFPLHSEIYLGRFDNQGHGGIVGKLCLEQGNLSKIFNEMTIPELVQEKNGPRESDRARSDSQSK